MLRFDDKFDASKVEKAVYEASQNYIFQPGDLIRIDVFTNGGEQLIDPNFQMGDQRGAVQNQQGIQMRERFTYLVLPDGTVRLPKVDYVELQGLNMIEAEEKLDELYEEFYKDAFVRVRPANRRVVVLGAV
jgi:polysaccharide export outer membrane protein